MQSTGIDVGINYQKIYQSQSLRYRWIISRKTNIMKSGEFIKSSGLVTAA
jgi:hypothetical protein